MFTLTIKTNNQAFEYSPLMEVCNILQKAIDKMEQGQYMGSLQDGNGNTVGNFEYDGPENLYNEEDM